MYKDKIKTLKIEFCIPNNATYNIAQSLIKNRDNIKISNKSITYADYSTIVSAGNSFGQMNGGVDGYINTLLSNSYYRMGDIVSSVIYKDYAGELPVGSSIIVPVENNKYKYLIYTPTMRIAEPVENTLNSYLAFRSSILTALNNDITCFSTPLFCTGAGEMLIERSIRQMIEAYDSIYNDKLNNKQWKEYIAYHNYLKKL